MAEQDSSKATTTEGKATGRHAVYDVTLQRFLGGPHADKASADKAKRELGKDNGHELETRPV
jgi:hypothetical protein